MRIFDKRIDEVVRNDVLASNTLKFKRIIK
jgi:hypothetical protein